MNSIRVILILPRKPEILKNLIRRANKNRASIRKDDARFLYIISLKPESPYANGKEDKRERGKHSDFRQHFN